MHHVIQTIGGGYTCTCGATWAAGSSEDTRVAASSAAMRHATQANGVHSNRVAIDPSAVLAIIEERDRLTRERFAIEARMHELREESDRLQREFVAVDVRLHDALGAPATDDASAVAAHSEGYRVAPEPTP